MAQPPTVEVIWKMQFERCFPIRHLAVGDAFGTGVTKRWATAVVDGVLTCFKYHRIVSQTAESSRSLITSHSQDFHQAWDIFHRSNLVFLKNLVDTPKSHGFPHFRPQIGGKSSFWSKTHKRMGASSCFWSTCPSLSAGFSDVFSRKSGHKNCRADGTFDGLYVDCTFGRGPGDVTSIMKWPRWGNTSSWDSTFLSFLGLLYMILYDNVQLCPMSNVLFNTIYSMYTHIHCIYII